MTEAKQQIVTGPMTLPIVQYGRSKYFADLLLGQFRDSENPHHFVDFDSEQGRDMCRHVGVVWCKECGMAVIISKAFGQQTLRCMQCMDWLCRRLLKMNETVIDEDFPGCIRDCSECCYFDPQSGTCELSGRE